MEILPILKQKAKGWDILIVEQGDSEPFNRGKLLNIGFLESKDKSDYYIFHDVDMIAENDPYEITEFPTCFVRSATQFGANERPYALYFGGVTGISKKHFSQVNGFYNDFWGYGAEDDFLLSKIAQNDLPWKIGEGVFKSLDHKYNGDTPEHKKNGELLNSGVDNANNGVKQCKYDLISESIKDGVRHIVVNTKPINKTITITCNDRPHYFKQICETLRKNDLRGWKIVVAFEPTPKFEEQKAMIDTILNDNDEVRRAVFYVNDGKKGVRANPYGVLDFVFNYGSEINIYLEDDIIISPDVTKIAEWFNKLDVNTDILAVKLINEGCISESNPDRFILSKDSFAALGLIIKKDSWFKHFKPNWFKNYVNEQGVEIEGWDWMIHRGLLIPNHELYTIYPEFSRSNHTGREGGTHCSVDFHDATFGNVKVFQGSEAKYYLDTGI